jgi:HEAT repeat protein
MLAGVLSGAILLFMSGVAAAQQPVKAGQLTTHLVERAMPEMKPEASFAGVVITKELLSVSPEESAWAILRRGQLSHSTKDRTAAVHALGLLKGDPVAEELAEHALSDKKSQVRAAAATALGQIGSSTAIPHLLQALKDKEMRVVLAASNALLLLGNDSGYEVYYELLTGKRKSGEGYITDKKRMLKDPKQMTILGLGIGMGFAPYAGYAWLIAQEASKDYRTPVRVDAAKRLVGDPDPQITQALLQAASDKKWQVRAAALEVMAYRGDANLSEAIAPHMLDKERAVQYIAAAAVIRLSPCATCSCGILPFCATF